MKLIIEILKGMVIGLANVIPGVSGGTMMVSMGIYDTLIWCINNLFKHFVKCVKTIWPYLVGMVAAIIIGAFTLKVAFKSLPLPTNTLFIGLILGGVPTIWKEMKDEKKGVPGIIIFVIFFAVVVALKAVEGENATAITLSAVEVVKLLFLGAIASATMVIPGVSGSMILKTLGYYEPIVTEAIPGLLKDGIAAGNLSVVAHNLGILLPFAVGIVIGIFGIAKLIDLLMRKWKGQTYCAIMGMVVASPVAILMDSNNYAGGVSAPIIIISVVTFMIGLVIAMKLGGEPTPVEGVSDKN